LQWTGSSLRLLDQRKLPSAIEYEEFDSAAGVAEAIKTMRVRGAPAIGIAAAFGVVLAASRRYAQNPETWKETVNTDIEILAASRPTAVNLFWALAEMRTAWEAWDASVPAIPEDASVSLGYSVKDMPQR
jgi:methylthioribose-1-phosphate isomerase